MKKILVIDDERVFNFLDADVMYCRVLPDINILLYNLWDEVWLDNDLGYSGGEVRHLIDNVERNYFESNRLFETVHKWVIHTQNPVARQRMYSILGSLFDNVTIVADLRPFLKES